MCALIVISFFLSIDKEMPGTKGLMSGGIVEELCVAGACHRGISYIGAFKKLEQLGILKASNLKRVIGVSIGSFIIFCYILGYPMDDILEYVLDTEIHLFKDIELCENSFLKGAVFRAWIHSCVVKVMNNFEKDKEDTRHGSDFKHGPDITMIQLYEKTHIDFTIVTTCLESGVVYINYKTRPNMKVYDALICSMNVPIVFPPYEVNGLTYIDGGLLENFPIHLLGYGALGIKSSRTLTTGPFAQIDKMMSLITKHISSLQPCRTEFVINLDSDNTLLNFDINCDDKITLYRKGYESIEKSIVVHKILNMMKFKKILDELVELANDIDE